MLHSILNSESNEAGSNYLNYGTFRLQHCITLDNSISNLWLLVAKKLHDSTTFKKISNQITTIHFYILQCQIMIEVFIQIVVNLIVVSSIIAATP